jgi:hypothetical protein
MTLRPIQPASILTESTTQTGRSPILLPSPIPLRTMRHPPRRRRPRRPDHRLKNPPRQ